MLAVARRPCLKLMHENHMKRRSVVHASLTRLGNNLSDANYLDTLDHAKHLTTKLGVLGEE